MRVLSIVFWHWAPRLVLFWACVCSIVLGLDWYFSKLDIALIFKRVAGSLILFTDSLTNSERDAALNALSQPNFIFSVAFSIAAVAFAFMVTFLLTHVCVIVWSMYFLRRKIERQKTRGDFAREYDQSIYAGLERSSLLGHAWREFDETLVKPFAGGASEIINTVRPQSFINLGIARDRLFGLKMMPSIPGYFVAVGLLLTFMGIVLALYKAGAASSAQDVTVMQKAMTELLQIASFKFATSIAGLGCSLILSILFKVYMIWIEASFHKFCEAVEDKLKYVPPQSLALEMNEAAKEQRDQLKEINSDKFFAQMGRQLEPQIHSAFATAIAPINDSISGALNRISETSQSGVSDMLAQFSSSVHGSAGTELRELAETLKAMQVTLAETQNGVRGTGEDFARRMSDAAENLNRLVIDAAISTDEGAVTNRNGLNDILTAMKETFARASSQVDAELGKAAGGASERIEAAMGRVMEKLESQVSSLSGGMATLDTNLRQSVAQTQDQIRSAQQDAVATVSAIAASSAEAVRSGLAEAIITIRDEIGRFESALRSSGSALASQASAIGDATSQTRLVSDAFSKTANDVRSAAAPLLQSGERIAAATSSFETSLRSAVEAFATGNAVSQQLATSIREQGDHLVDMWRGYEGQFARIDEALAKSVSDLATATERQGDTLSRYATEVDKGLAQAVTQLSSSLTDINDSVEEFAQSISDLKSALRPTAE